MKKLLLLALLAVGMTAKAETTVNNSAADDEDKSLIDLGQGKDKNDRWSVHAYVGVDIPTGAPDGVDFAPFRSWEINITPFQYDYTPKDWKTTFSAGLGINWRTYTLRGHDKLFGKVNGWVTVGNSDPNDKWDDLSSNIQTTSLSMPLLVKQRISKGFAVSVGAQLNWNFYSRIHTYFERGDDELDAYTKKIGQRPFTVDVLGIVHVGKLGVYCKYSPMSVLKKDRGPEFKSLAVGLYF